MAKSRKDSRGRALRKGELQRSSDGRYVYTYVDVLGRRRSIYAKDLAELRERERELIRKQLDGLDAYSAGKVTLNEAFDRYIATKYNVKTTTLYGYKYTYDHFVRDSFGKKKISSIKYTDVLQFYHYLLEEKNIQYHTLGTVHCVLHPTFQMAVRDGLLRINPSDRVMASFSPEERHSDMRHALTLEQQRSLMSYCLNDPISVHWWPIFTVLLGTGCRISEALGLRWQDLDFENRTISINHALESRRSMEESTKPQRHITTTKSKAGDRVIPMFDSVKKAFEYIMAEQADTGPNESVIDGMSGFIFKNELGLVPDQQSVNRALSRAVRWHNKNEMEKACEEERNPIIIPHITCHIFRHTFATRLCTAETNLKVIQDIMGHSDINTTMGVYAEATYECKKASFVKMAEKFDVY